MTEIRNELLRFVALNKTERRVPADIALAQLEHFGNRLIPGLVACLNDDDTEVKLLAIELLGESQPRSDEAVPALIERLKDENKLVQIAAAYNLSHFGPVAAAAIPLLKPWLSDDLEYIRVLAATTIMRVDPARSNDVQPILRAALRSQIPLLRQLAEYAVANR